LECNVVESFETKNAPLLF